jgi:hypothetical protein
MRRAAAFASVVSIALARTGAGKATGAGDGAVKGAGGNGGPHGLSSHSGSTKATPLRVTVDDSTLA